MVKPVLTPTEAASYLRLAVGTLANWRWRGEGPPYVLYGRRVRYRRSDLDAWMEGLMHHRPDPGPLPPPPTPRAALHTLAPRRRASRAKY
jgi:excisionase family DNA binding protein